MGVVSDPDESCMPAGCSPACPFRSDGQVQVWFRAEFLFKRGRELPAGTLPRHRNSSQRAEKKVQRENEPCFFHHEVGFPTHRQPCEVAEHKIPVGSVRSHADNAFVASRSLHAHAPSRTIQDAAPEIHLHLWVGCHDLTRLPIPCSSSSPLRELRR